MSEAEVSSRGQRMVGAGRGSALKESMRRALAAKKGAKDTASAVDEPAEDESVDPWPDVRIPTTSFGVEDARSRAMELRRRGAFQDAAKMWSKVLFLARNSQGVSVAEIADCSASRAEALMLIEDWASCERFCRKAVATAQGTPGVVRLLCARARSHAELHNFAAARADMAQAHACELDSMDDSMDSVQAHGQELEARIHELEQYAAHAAAAQAEAARNAAAAAAAADAAAKRAAAASAAAASSNAASSRSSVQSASSTSFAPTSRAKAMSQATAAIDCRKEDAQSTESINNFNQHFFGKLETDFQAMCAGDGWDEILKAQKELLLSSQQSAEQIDPESDYFRIKVPLGEDREIRPTVSTASTLPVKLHEARPRRNLDELRRVERETQEAIEKEIQARAARKSEPIRTRSDVVRIDSLDDESDDEENEIAASLDFPHDAPSDDDDSTRTGSEAIDNAEVQEQARKTLEALQEFDRLAREKEARLARWRERFGD